MRALLALAFVLGCDPYDPDLGTAPFLCGTDEPRCPDGYVARDVSAIRCECQRAGDIDGGGGAYVCNGDTNEPNESTSTATITLIGVNTASNYNNVSICPADDEDHYRMEVPAVGTLIVVRVTFDRARRPPRISILAESGAVLTMLNESPEPGVLVATFTATYAGTYFARIQADVSRVEVNYDVRLMITLPS